MGSIRGVSLGYKMGRVSTSEERGQLVTLFLGLAGRVQRLAGSDPATRSDELARWIAIYRSEIDDVLRHQSELIEPLTAAGVTSERLTLWIEQVRKVLSVAGSD